MKELNKYPKVKGAFEKWYDKNGNLPEYWIFLKLPFSMQFGVWVDFCDSEGVYINKMCPDSFEIQYGFTIKLLYSKVDRTRTEARQQAFKKSLTILNSKI